MGKLFNRCSLTTIVLGIFINLGWAAIIWVIGGNFAHPQSPDFEG
jgi:hypothetical protein